MYDTRPNLTIGFHGCDRATRDLLLTNPDQIQKSEKPHDWLGHGMYFWEYNEVRAMEWAESKALRKKIKDPAVIGAVLDVGACCDLLDNKYIDLISTYHTLMKASYASLGKTMPVNQDAKGDRHEDKLIRELDCAVIEYMNGRIFAQNQKILKATGYSNINPAGSSVSLEPKHRLASR